MTLLENAWCTGYALLKHMAGSRNSFCSPQCALLNYVISVDKQASEGEHLLGFDISYEDASGNKFSDAADCIEREGKERC